MGSVALRLTRHAQLLHGTLHSGAFCKARRPAGRTSLPRASCVIAARRCSKRRAEALAAVGAQARAAGRVERSAVRAAAAGRRWAGARGQVRGRRSPWARKVCKSPGRTPGSPLEWAGLREGWAPYCSRDPAAVAAPAGLPSQHSPSRGDGEGKPRQQRVPRAAGSWDHPLTAVTLDRAERHAPQGVPGMLWRPLPSLQPGTAESGGMLPIFQMGKARRSS